MRLANSNSDSDSDYEDMPPLIPASEANTESDEEGMPELVPAPNSVSPHDDFVNTLNIGDTFKTPSNDYMIYLGRNGELDRYEVEIRFQNNVSSMTWYTKLGIYATLYNYEKIEPLG